MSTPESRLEQFQHRLQSDPSFRAAILADREALLRETGLPADAIGDARPVIVGDGESAALIFVQEEPTGPSAADATEDTMWPWRQYRLLNHTDRPLNFETWRIGLQEYAHAVEPGYTFHVRIVTQAELDLRLCNILKGSFLARDLVTNRVLKESGNVTCGRFWNVLTATGSGTNIHVAESHPEEPVRAEKPVLAGAATG
ncbi:MAG TPA: hypothetical protein VFS20_22945 [Longimicrobium sp.]|nr:hypothetical protein [Longimicrobium sp.]